MIQSRHPGSLLMVVVAVIAVVAISAQAASAKEPASGFTQFAGCPSPEENPKSELCARTVVTGGNFKMGSKNVPIEKPIVLVGGSESLQNGGNNFSYNSKGGMLPAPQKVPGGVVGITGLTWLLEFFGVEALTLYATTELAGTPGSLSTEPITLPIKVHLTTPSGVLGKNCYVGSSSNPIKLNLITGTTSPPSPNKPITGKTAEVSFDELGIIHLTEGQFVDNSFAAPGASGCVLTVLGFIPINLDSIVDLQAGLPAAAGTNETRQDFEIELAESSLVYP